MQRIINWGGTTYYECQFDTPKDFELFAEYWNAEIKTTILRYE